VRTTPGRLPNRESGPQNHPRAKVAVLVSFGALRSIDGTLGAISDGVGEGVIVALSFAGTMRIAAITIPTTARGKTIYLREIGIALVVSCIIVC
jgi:TolB-like protein